MKFYKSAAHSPSSIVPLTQHIVEEYAPIVLFVNKKLDILYTNGDVSQFLTFPKALAQFNVAKMLEKDGVVIFKNCVDRAIEKNTASLYKDYPLSSNTNKPAAYADFYFEKFDASTINREIAIVRVLIHNSPAEVKDFPPLDNDTDMKGKLDYLEREVMLSQRKTQTLVSELEATNEELKTSNRELLASNEELVSTNEELQSVNEELHTVNSELQLKNDELLTTKTDIKNMLTSTNIGILFLDSYCNVSQFNESIKVHYDLQESDIGRPITDFRGRFEQIHLKEIAENVYSTLEPYEQEAVNDAGQSYLIRVLPYRTSQDQIKGVVITFLDVHELAKAKAEWMQVAVKFRAIFNNIQDTVISIYEDGRIRNINKSLIGYEKEELLERRLVSFFPEAEREKLLKTIAGIKERDIVQSDSFVLFNKRYKKKEYFDAHFMSSVSKSKRTKEEEVANTLIILKNRTEDIEKKANLEETLELYYSFMKFAKQQIILVDQDLNVVYINHWMGKPVDYPITNKQHIRHYLPDNMVERYIAYVTSIFEGEPTKAIVALTIEDEEQQEQLMEYVGIPVATTDGIRYVATISDKVRR